MESTLTNKLPQEPDDKELELLVPTAAQKKAQRNRSVGLAIALILFVVVVYIGTWAKLGSNIFIRPM
ncbi:hypothetical protein C7374_101624 [Falsochrobactrum ovis]|uniref:CoxF protein n=1 Tax=Falsochrobactrum ovis TaxID=1293442 RepID=A0A364K061_9HYPH|nr:hypothetical protein [Falsochrobactrum ovis]RAK34290.1 hypothetical protein C7374_101624 [Falsochrobactrum ovis]